MGREVHCRSHRKAPYLQLENLSYKYELFLWNFLVIICRRRLHIYDNFEDIIIEGWCIGVSSLQRLQQRILQPAEIEPHGANITSAHPNIH